MALSPLQRIHFETGALFVFLTMLLVAQWNRAGDSAGRVGSVRSRYRWAAAVFLGSLAAFTPLLQNVSLPLAAGLAAAFTLALLHPVNALCFYIHMLFLRPWEVMPENLFLSALPELLAGTCAVAWLLHPGKHVRPAAGAWRALLPLGGFALWLFLTTFAAPDAASAQAEWFGSYFKVLIVFALCILFIGDGRGVAQLEATIVISVLAMVSLALFEYFQAGPEAGAPGRLGSHMTMLDPNDLAAVTVMAFPLVLAPFLRGTGGAGSRFAGLALAGASLAAVWYSQSRGALVALSIQIFGMRYIRDLRSKWLGAVFLAGLLAAGYAGVMKLSARSQEDMAASSESRVIYWKAAVNMAAHHLLLGVGFGEYPRNYESYSSGTRLEWGERTAHSSWLLAFAEAGVVGGALFLAFFLSVWRTAWRRRRERPEQLCALLGYAVAMTFLSHTYLLYPYLLCGLVLASESAEEPSVA